MKFVFCTLICLSLAFASSGCSRGSGGANANQISSDQGQQYTDANQELTNGIALWAEGEPDRAFKILNKQVNPNPDLPAQNSRPATAYGLFEAPDAPTAKET